SLVHLNHPLSKDHRNLLPLWDPHLATPLTPTWDHRLLKDRHPYNGLRDRLQETMADHLSAVNPPTVDPPADGAP
ncbi:hypothetical protein C0993_012764, partial [Termitomyces sp. T159_Od127]